MDGEEVYETYAIDPATQARTLTSSGGDQYYIRKDGVVSVAKLAEALKNRMRKRPEITRRTLWRQKEPLSMSMVRKRWAQTDGSWI